VIKILNTY